MSKQDRSFITCGVTEVLVDVRVFRAEVVSSLNEELTLTWNENPMRRIEALRAGDAIEISDKASVASKLPRTVFARLKSPTLTVGIPVGYTGRVAIRAEGQPVAADALGTDCDLAVSCVAGRVSLAGCLVRSIDVEGRLSEVELLSCDASEFINVETDTGGIFCYLLGDEGRYTVEARSDGKRAPLDVAHGDGPVAVTLQSARGKVFLSFSDRE